jgi:hypothetical protein
MSRAWKMERASVHKDGKAHSNKYSKSDSHPMPEPGTRERVWVGGYTKSNGMKVAGHYRSAS